MNNTDKEYFRLLMDILENGKQTKTGAKLHDQYIDTISLKGRSLYFNLGEGFPILTTRKISWKNIIYEMLWFLGRDTNINVMQNNGVKIWNSWVDENNSVGPLYPKQLRGFSNGKIVIDQINELIDHIRLVKENPNNRFARRLVLTTWNPADFTELLPNQLYPCHGLITQFFVEDGELSCTTYQRSADVFLGLSSNISSYALLLSIIAHLTNLSPRNLYYFIGDAHIYTNHLDVVKEQLTRIGHPLPQLNINPDLKSIDDLKITDFELVNYQHDPLLKGEVAI